MIQDHIRDLDGKEFHGENPQKLEKWKIVSKLIPSSGLILDVGCYDGTFSRYFRTLACMHGIAYVGVNVSNEALKDAKRKKWMQCWLRAIFFHSRANRLMRVPYCI